MDLSSSPVSSDLVSNELSYDVNTSVNDQSTCRVCDVPGNKILEIHNQNNSCKIYMSMFSN